MVVALGVGLAILDLGGDDDAPDGPKPIEREGSEAVDDGEVVEVGEEPEGYRITYQVTERTGEPTTEEVTVRRPFVSETTIRRGEDVIGVSRSAFGRLVVDGQVFAVPPGVAGADLRLPPALEEAEDRGWVERREQRVVAGRRCQVYRFATTVLGGALQPPADPEIEHADACFDAAGLLLEEWWVLDGEPLRRRVAVDVALESPRDLGADWEALAPTMDVERGGGSVLELAEGSMPPGSFFVAEDVPAGFDHLGRYSVIPPQAAEFGDAAQRGRILTSTVDVWQRGLDLLVVDQGGTLEQQRVFEVDPDNRVVVVPGLGDAEIIVGLAFNEVRVLRPAGRFIRVQGTLQPGDLLEVVRGLVEVEGNELVLADP